jgi:uncharacterized protein YhbP (UPF0306 family)
VTSQARQNALAYLHDHRVMTLATWGDDGVWAAAVFYVNREFDLLFLSAGHTRHAQNMKLHPQVAAIQEDYEDWPAIQGIQLEGIVRQLVDQEQQRTMAWYIDKFPFLDSGDQQIAQALPKVNWYELQTKRLYFIDNSQGLGHREEISLLAG